ncbi:MAG: hypothetical protein COW30_17335 [Rhodospirillales bacterium CG15_BIG_FIL_POST_REV_8_21_14_020_66_15]|nr:MAG: hypothetical protein COW30_17335 [Rhodospirillales bacterium CG15_BIG_FIL_POST_REV_8_21_14_020_66_15]
MKRLLTAAVFAGTLSILASAAFAMPPVKTANTAQGPVLTDAKGMTLYTFKKDTLGKSACYGKCAVNWPPLAAGAEVKGDGDYSVITRDDGKKQWAYKGKALYGWVKDEKPGQTTGHGVKGVWEVARP